MLGVIHYAYRSYNSLQGRWLSRDLVDIPAVNPYALCSNTGRVDYRGTYDEIVHYYFLTWYLSHFKLSPEDKKLLAIGSIYVDYGKWAATKIVDKKTAYNLERERNSKLLHNLGSLDKNGIECYRDCLKRLFDRTDEPLDSFQKGVLLHLSGILDYQEFEDIEDGDLPSSSMFTGMKRRLVQELQQSDF